MILRTYCLLSLGLKFVVGLVFDILQIFGRHDFSIQLQSDNRVEWPFERFFTCCVKLNASI